MSDTQADLRRHPRSKVSWPVTVETGGQAFERQTVNLSPVGAKVHLEAQLQVGAPATLRFRPPHGRPLEVEAIVWRSDSDGPAFFFVGVGSEEMALPR